MSDLKHRLQISPLVETLEQPVGGGGLYRYLQAGRGHIRTNGRVCELNRGHPTIMGAAEDSNNFLRSQHEDPKISPETQLRRHSLEQSDQPTPLYGYALS